MPDRDEGASFGKSYGDVKLDSSQSDGMRIITYPLIAHRPWETRRRGERGSV